MPIHWNCLKFQIFTGYLSWCTSVSGKTDEDTLMSLDNLYWGVTADQALYKVSYMSSFRQCTQQSWKVVIFMYTFQIIKIKYSDVELLAQSHTDTIVISRIQSGCQLFQCAILWTSPMSPPRDTGLIWTLQNSSSLSLLLFLPLSDKRGPLSLGIGRTMPLC